MPTISSWRSRWTSFAWTILPRLAERFWKWPGIRQTPNETRTIRFWFYPDSILMLIYSHRCDLCFMCQFSFPSRPQVEGVWDPCQLHPEHDAHSALPQTPGQEAVDPVFWICAAVSSLKWCLKQRQRSFTHDVLQKFLQFTWPWHMFDRGWVEVYVAKLFWSSKSCWNQPTRLSGSGQMS